MTAVAAPSVCSVVRTRIAGTLTIGGFLILTLVLRYGSFHRSVIDWDESVILIFGRSLLRGDIPYTTHFDHVPVGGIALFAGIQALFGQSVLAIRVATWLSVGLTCYLVYLLAKRTGGGSEAAGRLAGLLYGVFTVFNLGLAAHRELFLAPLVTFAALMVLAPPSGLRRARLLAAGIALGCAVQLKQMYVFECVAIAIMATLEIVQDGLPPLRTRLQGLFAAYALLTVPGLMLLAAEAAWFWHAGHWPEFLMANFLSPISYVQSATGGPAYLIRRLLWQTRSYTLVWLGAVAAPIMLRAGGRAMRRRLIPVLVWFVAALAGTLSTGRYWDHYFLQLVAPGAVLTGLALAALLNGLSPGWPGLPVVLLLFALAPLYGSLYPPVLDTAQALKYTLAGQRPPADGPTMVADYLRPRLESTDAIYVADYEPIIYYLTDAVIPTRFPFPPHLTDPQFAELVGSQVGEFRRIMDSRPRFVVVQRPQSPDMLNPALAAELSTRLARDYVLRQEIATRSTFGPGLPISVEIYETQ